jgi:hypothetical protein
MATLAEIRAQYPNSANKTDEEFARELWTQSYRDMPFADFKSRVGLVARPTGLAPEDEVRDAFPNGSIIARNMVTGVESYMDPNASYATSDPATIDMIRAAGGDAGKVFGGQVAQEQIGEGASQFLSAAKGIPFVRGYVPQVAAGVWQAAGGVRGMPQDQLQGTIEQAIAGSEMEAPTATMLTRMGVGAVTGAPMVPALRAQTLAGRIGEGILTGAAFGGAEGLVAGYGEGGLQEAKRQAQAGAVGGGIFGAGAPVAGAVAAPVVNRYFQQPVRKIMDEIGFKGDASRVVQDVLALDSATAVESAAVRGPYGNVGTLGPASEALLDKIANDPDAALIVSRNLKETADLAADDLVRAFDTHIAPPRGDLVGQKAQIMADTADARRELYGAAYDVTLNPADPANAQLLQVANRVDPSDLAGARTLLREAGEEFDFIGGQRISANRLPSVMEDVRDMSNVTITSNTDGSYTVTRTPTVASLDYLSRRLHSRSEALLREGDFAAANSKRDLAMQIRRELDAVNPDYAAARAAGADAIDQRLAAQVGNDILKPSVTRAEIERTIQNMGDVEMTQLRQALRNSIDEIQSNARVSPTGKNDAEVVEALAALRVLNTRAISDKLRMVLGDEAADALGQQIAQTSGALMQRASVAANSRTFIRGRVDEKMRELVGESLGETVARQGAVQTMSASLIDKVMGGPKQSERMRAVAQEIAPVLTQRLTPEDLAAQARRLEALTPAISQARLFADQNISGLQRTVTAGGVASAQQDENSPTNELLRYLRSLR